MREINYKYNYWVLIPLFLFLLIMINPVYRMVSGYPPPTFNDYWHAALILSLILFLMWISLSMLIKIVKGIPVIALTDEQLIVNTKKVAVNWTDIKSVRIGGSKSSYLIIELTDSNKYFPNSLMRKVYSFFSWTLKSNEFAIGLALVLGNNDEILKTIKEFHKKHK